MSRLWKMAWINIVVLGIVFILSVLLIMLLPKPLSRQKLTELIAGLLSYWLLIILGLFVFSEVWTKRRHNDHIGCDERDLLIQVRSLHVGAWFLMGVFLYMWWLVVPEDALVKLWMPILLGSSAFAGTIAYSIAILFQYGWRGKSGG